MAFEGVGRGRDEKKTDVLHSWWKSEIEGYDCGAINEPPTFVAIIINP